MASGTYVSVVTLLDPVGLACKQILVHGGTEEGKQITETRINLLTLTVMILLTGVLLGPGGGWKIGS